MEETELEEERWKELVELRKQVEAEVKENRLLIIVAVVIAALSMVITFYK